MKKIFIAMLFAFAVGCSTEEDLLNEEKTELRLENMSSFNNTLDNSNGAIGGEYHLIGADLKFLGSVKSTAFSNIVVFSRKAAFSCFDDDTVITNAASVSEHTWKLDYKIYRTGFLDEKVRFENVVYSTVNTSNAQTKVITFTSDGYIISYTGMSVKRFNDITYYAHTICQKDILADIDELAVGFETLY